MGHELYPVPSQHPNFRPFGHQGLALDPLAQPLVFLPDCSWELALNLHFVHEKRTPLQHSALSVAECAGVPTCAGTFIYKHINIHTLHKMVMAHTLIFLLYLLHVIVIL